MYAKAKDVRRALFSSQPLFILMCKEAFLSTNNFDVSLPNVITDLLQEYQDVFPKEIPSGLPPTR